MNNNDLSVRVNCTHKRFKLVPPNGRCKDYQIRFTPPREVREALGIDRVERTTGTPQLSAAKQIAAQIIESHWSVNSAHMRSVKAREAEAKQKFPTVGEVLAVFREGAQTLPDKELTRDQTINHYCCALTRILETHFDAAGRATRAKGTAESMPIDEALRPKRWQDHMSGLVRRAGKRDPIAIARAKRSANAELRNARAMFSKDFEPLYAKLNMPDLRPLREELREYRDCAQGVKFKGIPQGALDALENEISSLRVHFNEAEADGQLTRRATDARGLYLAFYMSIYLGMRRSEILAARLEWISEFGQTPKMEIVARPYFRPKGTEGAVPIGQQQLHELRTLSGAVQPLDHLIPGPNRIQTWRLLSKIVRKYLGGRTKTCHELRKQAISIYLANNNGDLQAATEFSRHSNVATIQQHYADFLGRDRMRPITSTNWWQQQSNVVALPPQKAVL